MNLKRGFDRLLIYFSGLYFIAAGHFALNRANLLLDARFRLPPQPQPGDQYEVALTIIATAFVIWVVVYGLIWVLYGFFEWDLPRIDRKGVHISD